MLEKVLDRTHPTAATFRMRLRLSRLDDRSLYHCESDPWLLQAAHRDQAELGREGFVDASRLSLEAHLFPDDFIPEGRAHIVVAEFLQAWHGEDERRRLPFGQPLSDATTGAIRRPRRFKPQLLRSKPSLAHLSKPSLEISSTIKNQFRIQTCQKPVNPV